MLHYVFKSCLYFPPENQQLFLMKHILQINKNSINKMVHVCIGSVRSLILSIIFYKTLRHRIVFKKKNILPYLSVVDADSVFFTETDFVFFNETLFPVIYK